MMKFKTKQSARRGERQAQAAIEYLVLLGVVVVVVMISFHNLIPKVRTDAGDLFNQTLRGTYGTRPNADPMFSAYP